MRSATILFFTFIFLTLSACATGPTLEDGAKDLPPIAAGMGRVIFYRRFDFNTPLTANVLLDGAKAGNAIMRGVFFQDVRPGRHRVATGTWPVVEFDVSAGDATYIKLYASGRGYQVTPELVDATTGEAQSAGFHLIGPKATPGLLGVLSFLIAFIGISIAIVIVGWRKSLSVRG